MRIEGIYLYSVEMLTIKESYFWICGMNHTYKIILLHYAILELLTDRMMCIDLTMRQLRWMPVC